MAKRYKTVEKGIRKELKTGMYLANKTIGGQQYSKSFSKLSEARKWRREFHPLVTHKSFDKTIIENYNGTNQQYTLKEIWEKYQESHFPCLAFSTKEVVVERAKFFGPLLNKKMCLLNSQVIYDHVNSEKSKAFKSNSRRLNFNNDLKTLKAILNWYKENFDYKFQVPISRMHYSLGIVQCKSSKNKKMGPEQLKLFLEKLPEFYRDFATIQLMIGGRVQEVAGLLKSSIDLQGKRLTIENVAVWSRKNKKFVELKNIPKNGEIRYAYITEVMYQILEKRLLEAPKGCNFIFHRKGKPLAYRKIQYEYNKALRLSGLGDKFGSTHFLRHTMANITREVTGSLESTQAVTGHKDIKQVLHYSNLPSSAQMDAVLQVEDFLMKKSCF